MTLLSGFRVVQLGPGLAAAVCGRLLADAGAAVTCAGGTASGFGAAANGAKADAAPPLAAYLAHGKAHATDLQPALAAADLIVTEGSRATLHRRRHDPDSLRAANPRAPLVLISPFGQTGPMAEAPASDLTLFYASGIARLLTGQVDDLAEAPIRPTGRQSAFIAGVAAACAGMHAALGPTPGAVIDLSVQEALATLAMTELTRAGVNNKGWSRRRLTDGNGATVCILPARDGYVAISPREEHQWRSWLTVMGSPAWGTDPRFARKPDRVANWDALHALMSQWSVHHDRQWIANAAQDAHVPSFPLREPADLFASPQLAHRAAFRAVRIGDRDVQAPGAPFGLMLTPAEPTAPLHGPMPLSGVRVLDFSWVIAGPTTTRYLAAMGAEVIKVEAPGRGDPGRASELHTVLGQAKRGIVLDLKRPEAVQLARDLAAKSDVLIENFATGVMDRLGLGAAALQAVNPNLVYVSASGLGRSGPESHAVAYGTLLQCYAGFAGLNRHPDRPPRVGFAWLDPMCGLMLAFAAAAGLWQRQRGGQVARVDFSMIEAMLWTLAEPLLTAQLDGPPQPMGNRSDCCAPHGAYRCAGEDAWVALAVQDDGAWQALCRMVPTLHEMASLAEGARREHGNAIDAALAAWLVEHDATEVAARLRDAGIAAAALADSRALLASDHLRHRGFWEPQTAGVLPGLPWQASFGRISGPAPALGGDTESVLREVLALSDDAIARLRQSGALG